MCKVKLLFVLLYFIVVNAGYSKEDVIKTQFGSFKLIDKNSNIVVSAPHGTYDINTGVITNQVCKK